MSWSISRKVGTPEKVAAAVTPEFDACAKNYAGTPEEQDVLSAKASMLSWLALVPPGMAVMVDASGSRGSGWLSIKVECSTCTLVS